MPDEIRPDLAQAAIDTAKADHAKPSVSESAEKWAKEAQKVIEADEAKSRAATAAAEAGSAPEAAEKSAKADGEKPRGPDGKFLPEGGKPKEKANADKQKTEAKAAPEAVQKPSARGDRADGKGGNDPAEAQAPAAEPLAGSLGKAKRLVREGDIGGALELIGLSVDQIPGGVWASMRKHHQKREHELVAAHEEIQRQREDIRSEARALVEQLRPFAEAKAALESGDEDKVFEVIFGKSVDDWQRERLARMHRGDTRKDPAYAEILKRLDAEKAERERLEKSLREERETAAVQRAQAKYIEDLKGRIANHPDERVAAAASLPWFVEAVRDERRKHYDPRTDTSISEEEAIELVFDEERLTVAQWRQLTGGHSSHGVRDPGTQTQATTGRPGTDVKRAAKAPTTLSRSAAAEAAPAVKRSAKESLEYWAREGQEALEKGSAVPKNELTSKLAANSR